MRAVRAAVAALMMVSATGWAEPLAKISVSARGLCAVSFWELSTAGAAVEDLPVEEVAITDLGHRMASVVEDVDGDGVFNGSDRVIFFGQRLRGEGVHRYRYADENTYLLERLAPDERPLSPLNFRRLSLQLRNLRMAVPNAGCCHKYG